MNLKNNLETGLNWHEDTPIKCGRSYLCITTYKQQQSDVSHGTCKLKIEITCL